MTTGMEYPGTRNALPRPEGRGKGTRFALALLAAAVLLAFGTWYWVYSERRSALESAEAEVLRSGEEASVLMTECFGGIFPRAEKYRDGLAAVDPSGENARGNLLETMERLIKESAEAHSLWIIFEPDAFDGRDKAFVGRDGFGEMGRLAAALVRDGREIRRDAPDESMMDLSRSVVVSGGPAIGDVRSYQDTAAMEDAVIGALNRALSGYGGYGSYASFGNSPPEPIRVLPVALPLLREGRTTGTLGVELSVKDADDLLGTLSLPYSTRVALLTESGETAACNASWRYWNTEGAPLPDALNTTLERLHRDGGSAMAVMPSGEDGYFLYLRRIEIQGAADPWTLAFLIPAGEIYRGILEPALLIAITGYVILIVIGLVGWAVRRNKAQPDSVAVRIAAMQNRVAADEFRKLDRSRNGARIVAALFFIPSLFFMVGAEKRFLNALEAGDSVEARGAVSSMWTAAVIGACIGIPILILNIVNR